MAAHLVKAAGGTLVFEPGGHLVKELVLTPATFSFGANHWQKYASAADTDGAAFPDQDVVFATAFAAMKAVTWNQPGIVGPASGLFSSVSKSGSYWTSCSVEAYCGYVDTSAINGKTLHSIYIYTDYYSNAVGRSLRVGLNAESGTTPSETWSWMESANSAVVTGTGWGKYDLNTPLVLDDYLWTTGWSDNWAPPPLVGAGCSDFYSQSYSNRDITLYYA